MVCRDVCLQRTVTRHDIYASTIRTVFKVSLRGVVDSKSRGCRKLKRGDTGVPTVCI